MNFFLQFVNILTNVLMIAILIRAIISWFPVSRENPFIEVVHQVTEPILAPLRRVVPTFGAIDLTPLAAIFLLQLINSLVQTAP